VLFFKLAVSVVFSPDGKLLASAAITAVKLWSTETGAEV